MKIAFYSGIVNAGMTGMGVHLTNLLKNMVLLRPDNEYISFLPSLRNKAAHTDSALRIDPAGRVRAYTAPVPARALHMAQTYLRLPPMGLMLGRDYDLFHQMDVSTDPAVPSNKLVVSMHDLVSLYWPGQEAKLFARSGQLLRRAARIITVSEYSKQSIVQQFNTPAERVHVIYNGCDHSKFHPNYPDDIVRRSLENLGVNQPYIFYIGGQAPRKNLARIVAAFAKAVHTFHLPHMLVLSGPLANPSRELAEAIANSGCAGSIKILGFAPDDVVPHLYRGAEMLLFPSLFEGFGLPVAEAMACGTPVVTSNVTSLPEVAGAAAVMVDPTSVDAIMDGIMTIISEKQEDRADRIACGLAQAQTFSWQKCAAQHLAVYAAVAQH